MKKTLIFSFLTLLISQFGFSQGSVTGGHSYDGLSAEAATYIANYDTEIKKHRDLSHTNLVGSIYINKEFSPAKLSNIELPLQIRYDAYSDEMELDCKEDIRYLLKKINLKVTFKESGKTYQVFSYFDNIESKKGFFVVLNQGDKVSLLLKETIRYYNEVKPTNGYDKYTPPTLKRLKDKLFIGYKNGTTSELPKKKKDFLKLFSSKAKDVEIFRKKNKLKYKNKEDLIQIFEYYNTL